MMKTIKLISIALIIFLFIGCEGYVEYTGTIYDAQTKEPIDSVQCIIVSFKDRDYRTYSDSVGNYYISTPLVGCVPNCDEYDVEFSKYGYKTQILKAPTDIYLEKE